MELEKLNTNQKKCVTYEGQNLLVLAGAGTGKTATIVARAIHLIKNGVSPKRIQILSFTRKSAQEIRDRISSNLSSINDMQYLSGATFHSWCVNIIQSNPTIFKNISNFTILDQSDQWEVFKMLSNKASELIRKCSGIDYKKIISIYSYSLNARISLTDSIIKVMSYQKFASTEISTENKKQIENIKRTITPIIAEYIKYKKEHNYLDFDDVLTIVATSLDKQESARTFIASQYDHILVDEAQDTNPLQWYLLKSFWSNCSLFCVGDDAQSIYSFRGADFNSIHSFIDRVPNAEVYKLTDNYRSTQPIIDLTNWLLKNSPIYYGKELKSARGDGKKPMLISTDNSSQEAEYVVNDILDNIQYRSYSDFLVLGRSGYALKIIEGSCIEKKIPYRILGGFAFMKAAHIRDILAPLNLIVNPKDNLSWTRYLQLWRGFGAVTVSKYITELSKMETINEHINYLEKQNLKNENIVQVLIDIQNHHTNPSQAISLTCKKWKKR